MKKNIILIVGCFCILAVSIIHISCKKEKEVSWTGCICQGDYEDEVFVYYGTPAEIKADGYTSTTCAALSKEIAKQEGVPASAISCIDK